MPEFDWSKFTENLSSTATKGQALLVQESRRDVARELILKMNALGKHGTSSAEILQMVIAYCEQELMRADQPS